MEAMPRIGRGSGLLRRRKRGRTWKFVGIPPEMTPAIAGVLRAGSPKRSATTRTRWTNTGIATGLSDLPGDRSQVLEIQLRQEARRNQPGRRASRT